MRMGGFSVSQQAIGPGGGYHAESQTSQTLPDDHIDHSLPSMTESLDPHGKDLVTQCLFGRLCTNTI